MKTKLGLLALFLLLPLSRAGAAAPEWHVSPAGNDANAGTEAAPFRSLDKAREAVRTAKKHATETAGATVVLHAGTYWLPKPFTLGPEDSGAPGAPIVYRAAAGESVWLNGGIPLKLARFAPVSETAVLNRVPKAVRGRVRACRLTTAEAAWLGPEWPDTWFMGRKVKCVNELFADGTRLPLARWPNEGYTTFGHIVEPADKPGETPEFTYRSHHVERWRVGEGVWLYGYWRRGYRAEFIRVKTVDRKHQTIRLAARNTLGALQNGGGRRYFALNTLDELDAPGEWFLDRRRNTLYFFPPADLHDGYVVLSVNPTAVLRCTNARYVEFHGLGIECSARDGIRIAGGDHCRLVGCEVRNVAFTGIAVKGDAHEVVGCDLHDTGNAGVEVESGNRHTLTPGRAVVDNCHIYRTNRLVRGGSHAVSIRGVGVRFSHNLIHDCGYIAIAFHGNDHVMEFNRLFRTNVEAVEGGVFYTGRDWTSRGSILRYNFVHHIEDSREGCGSATRFVHLDDSAPGIDIYGNVCYRLGGGVSICGGAANHVHDNLFVECQWGVDIGPRGQHMFVSDGQGGFRVSPDRGRWKWDSLITLLKRYHWNRPPYSTRYPKLVEIFRKTPIAAPWFNVIDRNVMVDCAAGIRKLSMQPEWAIIRDNWEDGDPGFVEPDPTKLDFRLRADAVVRRAIGFRPCPVEKVGLYASPERRTWPVLLDLPPKEWKPRWMRLREQAAKSLGTLPLYKAAPVTGHLVIDGRADPREWTPGDATGRAPDLYQIAELKWTPAGKKAKRPAWALVQTDGNALYVQFRAEVDPAKGVIRGHTWGRNDAVEIALAEAGETPGPVLVLRGYADGTWETTDESGAPQSALNRLREGGVQYAAAVVSKGLWTAEWRIPFRALGLQPQKHNPRLVFNLSVRNTGDGEWAMLKRTGGRTWEVSRAWILWLSQFGEAAVPGLKPSLIEFHVLSPEKTAGLLKPLHGCDVCAWAKPLGSRLAARKTGLPVDSWAELSFSFVPQEDAQVWLILLGDAYTDPAGKSRVPVWAYVDDLRVKGAQLRNGDFEQQDAGGKPLGWRPHVKPGILLHDPRLAASGEWLVKVAFDRRFMQPLRLKAGIPVTIRARVRGVPTRPEPTAPTAP